MIGYGIGYPIRFLNRGANRVGHRVGTNPPTRPDPTREVPKVRSSLEAVDPRDCHSFFLSKLTDRNAREDHQP